MTSTLENKEEIRELLASYCFHVDSGDAEAFVNLFTEDGVQDLGSYGQFRGRAAMLEAQQKKGGKPTNMRHLTTNILISVNGDEAEVKSYYMVLEAADRGSKVLSVGHYFDHVVRQNGRWLFKVRRTSSLPIDTDHA